MNYSAGFRRPTSFLRRNEYATYIQDTWKITPRLTLQRSRLGSCFPGLVRFLLGDFLAHLIHVEVAHFLEHFLER